MIDFKVFNQPFFDNLQFACGGYRHDHRCKPGFVYVARGDNGVVKIGYTGKTEGIRLRLEDARRQYHMGFTLLFALQTHCARQLENRVHSSVDNYRMSAVNGRELFALKDHELIQLSRIDTFAEQRVTLIPALSLL